MNKCNKPDCPNHLIQPHYCTQCADDENPVRHDHKPLSIAKVIEADKNQWKELITITKLTASKAVDWFNEQKPLIQLLDKFTEGS